MSVLGTADALLRGHGTHARPLARRELLALLLLAGFTYGLALGGRVLSPWQMLYSGLKVPMLLTVSCLVCLPSFFVINTLLGLREDFKTVVVGIAETQVAMALILASLAPFTAVVYLSSDHYALAIVWNGLMFLVASVASQVHLGRIYAGLIRSRPGHRHGKRIWLALYIFVTIQLAWMLRPFVGSPGLSTTFFRDGVWDNAYVVVARAVLRVWTG